MVCVKNAYSASLEEQASSDLLQRHHALPMSIKAGVKLSGPAWNDPNGLNCRHHICVAQESGKQVRLLP